MDKLSIEHWDLYYEQVHTLKDVNLSIPRNSIAAFIGPLGCGKSALLKTLNRMNDLIPGCKVTGKVLLDDADILSIGTDVNLLRKRVGMVFQKPNPFPMSVYDNICYDPRTHGIRGKAKLDELVESSLRSAVDQKEREIEGMCLCLLLKQQPIASDLRKVSSALKMITDMERIGDQAADISEIVTMQSGMGSVMKPELVRRMAKETRQMAHAAIDAYVADDYMVKPFGVMDLLSRVRAILRRTERTAPQAVPAVGRLKLDAGQRKVYAAAREVNLTHMEFELLRYLMQNHGIALSRERLLDGVWGMDYVGDGRTVDVHMRSLRVKLKELSGYIQTVRGVGYRLEDNDGQENI